MLHRPCCTIEPHLPDKLGRLRTPVAYLADRILGFHALTQRYRGVPPARDARHFVALALEELKVTTIVSADERMRIPAQGPCVVVANHPHGGIDGLIVMDLLLRMRHDVRVMANYFLGMFAELRPLFLPVDPFGGARARRTNITASRAARNWLDNAGILVLFPSGEVSNLDLLARRIVDPPWDPGVARLAAAAGAPVVPLHIGGRNSIRFQLSGLLHPAFRTALLLREMLSKKQRDVVVRVGEPVPRDILDELGDYRRQVNYLRTKTYLLGARSNARMALTRAGRKTASTEDVIAPIPATAMAAEIAALPPAQCLVDSGDFRVFYAAADDIPHTLQEIGRLRELSFREVGEGTGKGLDLDLYDAYYLHLFVWNVRERAIVGGYRLGRADAIIKRYGMRGLYVHSLFKLSAELRADLDQSIEVGRSFVRAEYQRSYSALMLLWKGISTYVVRNPRYRILFGPVSISNDYHPLSQKIIVHYLRGHTYETRRASLVKARRPFSSRDPVVDKIIDLDGVDLRITADLLNVIESDDRGVPVLLRQYLKLGGRILGFNIDTHFANSIDCLLWVDLLRTDPNLLAKYMGKAEIAAFHRHHGSGTATVYSRARQGL